MGAGSPTELHGRRTSFIQGVVTMPPKDRILAGTAQRDTTYRTLNLDLSTQIAFIARFRPSFRFSFLPLQAGHLCLLFAVHVAQLA